MRSILFFMFSLLLVFGIWNAEAVDVEIPDPNLEAEIRRTLDKPTGTITDLDLASLEQLHNARRRNISNLTGLEYCINLESLMLGENRITNIGPLEGLVKMTSLRLQYNYIDNISALANLIELVELDLKHNYITDISPLSDLGEMRELYLRGNYFSDISPLHGMTKLAWLELPSGGISDISALENMTGLTELDLAGNQIVDISPLTNLTDMLWLNLGHNQIIDISPLANLSYLAGLEISNNQISNISALANLTYLSRLELDGNQVSNISALGGLTYLTELYIDDNLVSDISSLAGLTYLTELELADNQISDITPLVNNPGLGGGDYVGLDDNPLSEEACTTHIPALEARGVDVDYDCEEDGEVGDVEHLSVSTGATGNVMDLQWESPQNVTNAHRYVIRYNTMPITESRWDESLDIDGEPIPGPAGSTESMAAAMPHPNVMYYFAIKVLDPVSGIMFGISNSPSAMSSIPTDEGMRLYIGWNMVAFMGSTPMSIAEAMSSISGKFTVVWIYDASKPGWLKYLANGPNFLNDLEQVKPGFAYWIQVTEECIWYFGGSSDLSPSLATTPKPPFVLYGKVSSGYDESTTQYLASSIGYSQTISLKVGNLEAVSYALGSNPLYGEHYVLEVPVDALFHEGDLARMYLDGALAGESGINLGGIGVVKRHDVLYSPIPRATRLLQNYPNPFNPETWIPFQLFDGSDVQVRMHNSAGRLVRVLDLGFKDAGYYISQEDSARWDGRNQRGEEVASGVYFYTIVTGRRTATRKMILAK